MRIAVLGINHKTAPVEIREKLSFSEQSLAKHLLKLKDYPGIEGCIILSTCNRTEIYASLRDGYNLDSIIKFLSLYAGVKINTVEKYSYIHEQREMVHHLFRVAAGLDSMVLGETQILGQVRNAYDRARECGSTNGVLNTLFQQAITVGKRVRTETGIDQRAVSISYVAVELAKNFFGSLKGLSVLIIGAGKMSELTAKYLVENGVTGVIVSNRSFERAVDLAGQFGGRAVKFNELYDYMKDADIVISCTGASHYVVRFKEITEVMRKSPGKKIMFIDIAVPRDVEPSIRKIKGVSLYDIDDLQNVVDDNLKERRRAAVFCEKIINEELDKFMKWLSIQFVVPTIAALKKRGEIIKQKELLRALNRLGDISERDKKVVGSMANSIVNQLLHDPVTMLKEYALTDAGEKYKEAIEKLYKLNEGVNNKSKDKQLAERI